MTEKIISSNAKMDVEAHHTGIPAGQMRELTEAGWNESYDKFAES